MKTKTTKKAATVTQSGLRAIARDFLALFLRGESSDVNRRDAAVSVLLAHDRRGE